MTDVVAQMNEANKEFSDWCEKLPIPLILEGCEIHRKVQAAMFALDDERRAAIEELASTSAALDRLREASAKLLAETQRIDPGIPIHPTQLAEKGIKGLAVIPDDVIGED